MSARRRASDSTVINQANEQNHKFDAVDIGTFDTVDRRLIASDTCEVGEDEKNEAETEPEGTLGQALGCLAMVVALVAVIAGVVWGIRRFIVDARPLVHMTLSRQPTESTFELEDETVVQVWADLEISHPGISPTTPNVELPHVVDYVIEIRGPEGVASTLRCNPFDSQVARTSGTHNSIGDAAGRSYDGRLEDCAVRLPAGAYTIRAQLESVKGAKGRVRLEQSGLILRRG